ncbi:conserved hypothetical protein [Vibrio chagasii]|nr:conserved hypothetical protein [Vibrio chagasii]CAH6900718.1 conserved hypothetical protein [Vibrio chagasii]CAH7147483.1 conserved hypothetical protein [Vibrio chagasii]CAH7209301.1 conserved hypothetical protein [Vibrio chagasii]CAH7249927.1 conserved hypothetical protein [Vibrio chagasii]
MRFQVEISKQNQLLFKVGIENIDRRKCETSLDTVLAKFPIEEGYQRHVLASDSETRYLKSTDQSIEVLAAIPIFRSLGER